MSTNNIKDRREDKRRRVDDEISHRAMLRSIRLITFLVCTCIFILLVNAVNIVGGWVNLPAILGGWGSLLDTVYRWMTP